MGILAVVHVYDIFAVELNSSCNRFCDELNHLVPVKTLKELGGLGVATTRETGRDIL